MDKSSPFPEEKFELWKNLTIPQTGIKKETGGYQPFSVMTQAHMHPARFVLTAGGIRASKSVGIAAETIAWAPHSDLIWLGGDAYETSRQEFEYVMEGLLSLGWTTPSLISFPQNRYNACSLETTWGTLIETKSLADPKTFASRAPDFIAICEPGQTSETSIYRALERSSTWRAKVMASGTFEDTSPWMEQMWQKYKRWDWEANAKSFTVPTYVNHVIFPLGKQDPEYLRMKRDADREGPDVWLRRLIGVPGSLPDIIFSDSWKRNTHVGEVEYTRNDDLGLMKPVYAAIDPGYSGESRYVVLAIQISGHRIRVIDEVMGYQKTHEQIKDECMKREWWPAMKDGTIDPYAGDAHPLGSVSPATVWAQTDHGGRVDLAMPKRLHVEELIRLIKSYLTGASGYTLEVSPRCERLIYEMHSWKRLKGPSGLGAPSKAICDAVKALGYFLTHHAAGMIGTGMINNVQVGDWDISGAHRPNDPVIALQEEFGRYGGVSSWLGEMSR